LEIPLVFGPPGFEETPTLKRSNAFELVAAECQAVRKTVGLLDISAFSRYEVTGRDAQAWLNRILAGRMPRPGRARLAPMLSPEGRLKGDLTVFNWGDATWWVMGSYYLREWHMRWFEDHIDPSRDGEVAIRDLSDAVVGFSLAGPHARDLLATLTHQDISHKALPFMACATLDVGLIRARVGRLSVAGELGYEINCQASEHITLREILLAAGEAFGLREYGYYALNSLRLGREAALREADERSAASRLVTLEVDAVDADPSGYEPVWSAGKRIGFVTSGGYGHTVGKSLAMALVDPDQSEPGTELTTHVVGVELSARVIESSPHDPQGSRMRAP
jgi:dimethylglycine dehydrogenase